MLVEGGFNEFLAAPNFGRGVAFGANECEIVTYMVRLPNANNF